jgi:hypothetical protein
VAGQAAELPAFPDWDINHGKEGTMSEKGCSRTRNLLLSAALLAVFLVSLAFLSGVSADPIAYWKGPLGIIEVYKGSGLARLVINLPGKTYTVEAPEEYYGGGMLAAETGWEIYWPHPHAVEFTDLSMTIMGTDVAVEQIADADTIWDRIAAELADSAILDLYGVPTLRASYAHPEPLFTGDVYDTTWYSDTLEEGPAGVHTVQYECMIARYLHMPYQQLTLRAAIFTGDVEVDSVVVDYPNSLIDTSMIGDSVIVRVANYDSVPTQDLFIRIYENMAGVGEDVGPAARIIGLDQNVPNPFRGTTAIRYELSGKAHVTLSVYSTTGRRVRTLVDGVRSAGPAVAQWDGTDDSGADMPSGIYFCKLSCGGEHLTVRMVRLK